MSDEYELCDRCMSLITPHYADAARVRVRILNHLKEHGPCTPEMIADALDISQTSSMNQLKVLLTMNLGVISQHGKAKRGIRAKVWYGFPERRA